MQNKEEPVDPLILQQRLLAEECDDDNDSKKKKEKKKKSKPRMLAFCCWRSDLQLTVQQQCGVNRENVIQVKM